LGKGCTLPSVHGFAKVAECLEPLGDFPSQFGIVDGLLVLFFIGAHIWIYRLYEERIRDRQKEIDRLAKDNHEYRDLFIKLINKHFGPTPKQVKPEEPKKATAKRLRDYDVLFRHDPSFDAVLIYYYPFPTLKKA
jgi:hypothetical protein